MGSQSFGRGSVDFRRITVSLPHKAGERGGGGGGGGGGNARGPECSEGPGNLVKCLYRLSSLYVCPE
jgi:hypothetical protein